MKDKRLLIAFEADKELKAKLAKLAKERELTVSGLIRYILKNYFKKYEQK